MLLKLIIILVVGGTSIYFSDFESEAALNSIALPIVAAIALISLALWFVALFHNLGVKQTYSSSSDGGTGIGGDAGGGDGGC
jgi:membrane protease YdiL (CAAX protease family)